MVNRDEWNNMVPTLVELTHCWGKQIINRKTNKCHFRLRKCSGFSVHVALIEMEGGQGWSVCLISFQVVTYKMTGANLVSKVESIPGQGKELPTPRNEKEAKIDWLREMGKISGRICFWEILLNFGKIMSNLPMRHLSGDVNGELLILVWNQKKGLGLPNLRVSSTCRVFKVTEVVRSLNIRI